MTLRLNLIRLAHANTALRPHLLPILKEAQKSADALYRERQRDCRSKLQHIEQLLGAISIDQGDDPGNYGYAGDVGYVAGQLAEIIDFLKDAGTTTHDENYSPVEHGLDHRNLLASVRPGRIKM